MQTVHDFEHGGHTNDFLIMCGDKLALTYNDKVRLYTSKCVNFRISRITFEYRYKKKN